MPSTPKDGMNAPLVLNFDDPHHNNNAPAGPIGGPVFINGNVGNAGIVVVKIGNNLGIQVDATKVLTVGGVVFQNNGEADDVEIAGQIVFPNDGGAGDDDVQM